MLTPVETTSAADRQSSPSVLERAFDLLSTFSVDHPQRCMIDISVEAGLPKSTTHRLLSQLVDLGVLERSGQYYRLGPRLFALGSLSAEESLRRLALPHLYQLQRGTGLDVTLAILAGSQILRLQRIGQPGPATRPAGHAPAGGDKTRRSSADRDHGPASTPLHCSAAGKLFLSFADRAAVDAYSADHLRALTPRSICGAQALRSELAAIAETGIARDDGENHLATRCVSAPVTVDITAVAAVSLIMPASRSWNPADISLLRETAVNITRALARSGVKSLLRADSIRLSGRSSVSPREVPVPIAS